LIDAAVLRAHVSSGVTLCAKNLFGCTSINPDWHKNAHDGFRHNKDGSASYAAFTDYLGHKDLGEKTMLFIIDGLYGNDNVDGPPHRKWKMAPFNDAWPNSIFGSFDGVAIDSVGFDFLSAMAFGVAASAYMSIGITERIRSTRAISENPVG
jgi:hypothetical protein